MRQYAHPAPVPEWINRRWRLRNWCLQPKQKRSVYSVQCVSSLYSLILNYGLEFDWLLSCFGLTSLKAGARKIVLINRNSQVSALRHVCFNPGKRGSLPDSCTAGRTGTVFTSYNVSNCPQSGAHLMSRLRFSSI